MADGDFIDLTDESSSSTGLPDIQALSKSTDNKDTINTTDPDQEKNNPDQSASQNPDETESQDKPGRRKRKKRDPFKGFDPVVSKDAAMQARELTSLSELKRIKKARVRHEGHRVVTDNVKKLKSLTIEPKLPPGEYINYYIEPVKIEYYIPRESRFVSDDRFLYIPLIDPLPREQDEILKNHMDTGEFIDIIKLMNEFPVYITSILETYNETMNMYESLSRTISEAENGKEEMYKQAFYIVESLVEYEPSVVALDFLGEFQSWNMNVLIRRLNTLGIEFSATDKTISYFIKKRNMYWDENNLPYDDRFETLAALFYEQAYPNRGLEYKDEDFFGDIFDAKFEI